eukprot:Lithocolla_globosa_v1_NODE_2055_length_2189_cov_4.392221.p2 type:complete len:154 gc:universal NODE_2055_length_2189_cov_4.392221:320-781(+)
MSWWRNRGEQKRDREFQSRYNLRQLGGDCTRSPYPIREFSTKALQKTLQGNTNDSIHMGSNTHCSETNSFEPVSVTFESQGVCFIHTRNLDFLFNELESLDSSDSSANVIPESSMSFGAHQRQINDGFLIRIWKVASGLPRLSIKTNLCSFKM